MTISSTTNTVSYTGNGSTTAFAVNYVFFGTGTSAEIQVVEVVTATGVESVKSNGSDFTVSGGNGATGTVTAAVAPASTVKWVINRTTTQTQETDYVENDPFPAESHEEALDRLTAVDQEQQRALDRTAQLPDGYTGSFDPTLPVDITGSTVLAFNAGATAFEVGPTTSEISNAQTYATNASSSATASASSAAASASSATDSANSATASAASAASAAGSAGTQSVDRFNGNGSTTVFTMTASPATENNTMVYISGVYQQKDTYSISGTTLTFSAAPPTGTGNIEVMHMSTLPTGISPTVGTTTTGAAGTNASVSVSGHELSFTIPRGDTGATGPQGSQGIQGNVGTAATIAVGSTTTGAAGSSAAVTNSGSSSAATFDFTVPRGDTGIQGIQGIQGPQGDTGPAGSLSGASDGTAGAPSISFSADTDTGVFRPGANQIGFTTGGTSRAVIDSGGLEVNGNIILDATDADIKLKSGGVGTTGALRWTFGSDSTSYADLSLPYDTRATVGLLLRSQNGYPITIDGGNGVIFKEDSTTETMRITSAGRVGIGTTVPDNLLHLFISSTTQTASTDSQLVIERNSNSGLTILSGNTTSGHIFFGDSGDNDVGQITYNHNSNYMQFTTNASEAMRIDSSGNVGIGVSPSYKLHVSGDIYATGNVTAYSSAVAKDNISTIDNALDIVEQLRGVTFDWKESGKKAVGLIYEEVKDVIPELTSNEGGHVGVAYQNTVAVLIEAVKTLSAKVKELESK